MDYVEQAVLAPHNIESSRLYTAQQVADLLGVTSKTVRTWINNGQLIALRPGPRSTRIAGCSILQILGHRHDKK